MARIEIDEARLIQLFKSIECYFCPMYNTSGGMGGCFNSEERCKDRLLKYLKITRRKRTIKTGWQYQAPGGKVVFHNPIAGANIKSVRAIMKDNIKAPDNKASLIDVLDAKDRPPIFVLDAGFANKERYVRLIIEPEDNENEI